MKCVVASFLLVIPAAVTAQSDTAATALNTVVVTAERTRSLLGASTASVSRIPVSELALTPRATVADVLRRVPGFALVDFDGLGFDPQLMVRGFYGGGEAEYVVVMVDGRRVGQLQNGTVPWAALPPLAAIDAIEVVRGSASPLYGDAAIGGVINIITRRSTAGDTRRSTAGDGLRSDISAGAFGGVAGSASVALGSAQAWAGGERTDGYRDHARRSDARAGVTADVARGIELSVGAHVQSFDEPGPLLSSLLDDDRRASDPLFRFDHTKDSRVEVALSGERGRVSGSLSGEWRGTDAVRTLALAPGFGDTEARDGDNIRALGSIQVAFDDTQLPGKDRFLAGTDFGIGRAAATYRGVASGDRDAYAAANGHAGDVDADGRAMRANVGLFAQSAVDLGPRLELTAGVRFDWVEDEFKPSIPSSDELTASHAAFSPRVGLNYAYAQGARSSGRAYISANGSFKTATLDQLFDQRPIPLPFDPFSVTTSNALLDPQHARNVEAGLYHTFALNNGLGIMASLAGYAMEVSDEIDFNVETLRYINIGRSRHRGMEAGAAIEAGRASVFANYTLQRATVRGGEDDGKQLKAIPQHTVSGGVTLRAAAALETGVIISHASGAFVDDANEIPLDGFTRVDGRVSYALGSVSVYAEVRNLLGAKYNTTGFVDPAGSGEIYFYPAAGRVLSAGVRSGFQGNR